MIFPLAAILLAFIALLAYFSRKGITWTAKQGSSGSIGMAIVVMFIAGVIGWALDAWIDWSIIPTYMYAVGGALQAIAVVFFAAFALLILSMFTAAAKVGTMVA